MNNYAYITLLSTEDYLPAVLILNENLKNVNSQYPLVVGVTENIADKVQPYLQKENIAYRIIPFMQYSPATQEKWMKNVGSEYTLNIASKFALFKLYEFDKLVFIDSDILIYKNIDNLFDYPDGAIYDNNGQPFIGLFVFIPENHPVDYYLALSYVFSKIESDVLEPLFFPFKSNPDYRIPFEYYVNITRELDYFNFNDIKVFHFCYSYKPWRYLTVNSFIADYAKEFPTDISYIRVKIVKDYIDNYLTPLFKKYPEFKQYCRNINNI